MNDELIKKLLLVNQIDISKFKDYYYDNYYEYYKIIYSKYRYGLELFLENKYHISKIDNYFKKANYQKLDSSKEDIYSKLSYIKYDYYYLRNNLYLDRLNKSILDLLLKIDINNKEDLVKLINIVSRTYLKVIKEYINEDGLYISVSNDNLNPDKSYLDGNVCYVFRYTETLNLFDDDTYFVKQNEIMEINKNNSINGLTLLKLDDFDFN